MRKQLTATLGFLSCLLVCTSANSAEIGIKPTQVQVGECVPPYIYIKSPASQSIELADADGNRKTSRAVKHKPAAHTAFFSVDCNSDDTYFIALNGIQYALKTSDHKPPLDATFPAGIYIGDGITVAIRRGKLISRTFDGPGRSDVLNEEFETWVNVRLGTKAKKIRGIYRSGP